MKILSKILAIVLLSGGLASCEFDNYEPPQSQLQGRVVYQGEPINMAVNEVYIELWEPGWQFRNRIDVVVAPEGTFSSLLFDADYKLMFRRGQGPFRMKHNTDTNSDTVLVSVRGNTVKDIEVVPYYMIRNPQITLTNGIVNARAALEKIITDANARNIERVSLYINQTQFVTQHGNYHRAVKNLSGNDITDMNNINLSLEVPNLIRSQSFVYARIGVKIQGVEHMLYSPVQQLKL